jgi:hypothetical protein
MRSNSTRKYILVEMQPNNLRLETERGGKQHIQLHLRCLARSPIRHQSSFRRAPLLVEVAVSYTRSGFQSDETQHRFYRRYHADGWISNVDFLGVIKIYTSIP